MFSNRHSPDGAGESDASPGRAPGLDENMHAQEPLAGPGGQKPPNQAPPAGLSQSVAGREAKADREPGKAAPALPITFSWRDSIPEGHRQEYLDILNVALVMVGSCPPKEDNLFQWRGDRTVLAMKRFQFLFTTSDDRFFDRPCTYILGGLSPTDDALTVAYGAEDCEHIQIVCALFLDRVFFDEGLRERPDALTHATIALAHEIYGNVQMVLEREYGQERQFSMQDRVLAERRSYQAGIDFLERLKETPIFLQLPEKTRIDLEAALVRERESLAYWTRADTETDAS